MVPVTLAALCHLAEAGLDSFINSWWHSAWGWQSQTGHRKGGGRGSNDIPTKPRGLEIVFLSQSRRHYFLPWLRNKGESGGGYFRGQGSQGPFRLTSFVTSCSTTARTGALGLTDENEVEEPPLGICGVSPLRECLLSMQEALGSIPSTTQMLVTPAVGRCTDRGRSGVQGHS